MTQEEKQLLWTDLCARLPYKVVVETQLANAPRAKYPVLKVLQSYMLCDFMQTIDNVIYKPYLRPMSSMTEEEKEELLIYVLDNKEDCKQFKINDKGAIESIDNNIFQWVNFNSDTTSRYIDWLNKNMFDYRGLIPMRLALEAPKGMYRKETQL